MNAQSPSTALTNVEPAHPKVAALAAGSVMAIVPQTFDDVYRFAQVLSRSGLVPYGMDTPEKVSVAILTGLEIGVKPMQAVQGIAVINGAPRIWGDLALAVVRGSGQLERFSETLVGAAPSDWPNPKSDEKGYKAVCVVKRRGEDEVVKEYSIADAMVAKLWNKSGPKGPTPWVTNPKRMLAMRARAFALRDAFTDILKGMPIAEEMIGDEADDAGFRPVNDRVPPPPPPEYPATGFQPGAVEIVEDATFTETAAAATPPGATAQDAGASLGNSAENASASAGGSDDVNPDDILANLIDCMAMCQTVEAIEEGYEHLDVEADLTPFDGYVQKARDVKASHLDRVAKSAPTEDEETAPSEDAAPPPPPSDDDGLAPAPPPAAHGEPDISTLDGYRATVVAKAGAVATKDDYAAFYAWWEGTRAHRNTVIKITDPEIVKELQGIVRGCRERVEA